MMVSVIIIMLSSCTDNQMARSYGGTETITLKPGERLVNMTWKDENLWVLTKQDPSQTPTEYQFSEKSSYGVIEGTVIVKER